MRKLLNVNNLFLIGATLCLWLGFSLFWQSCSRRSELVFHQGILTDKRISVSYYTERNRPSPARTDSTLTFHFTIAGNPDEFTVSWLPKAMNNLLERGDTVIFYTKPAASAFFGNSVSNGFGRITSTHSDREVFSLECPKYESPLLDFNEFNKNLQTGGWACLTMSLICVFGYVVKRYGNGFGTVE